MERKGVWWWLRWKKKPAKGEVLKRQNWREELETGKGKNMSDAPGKFIALLPGAQQIKTVSKRGWGWRWSRESSGGWAQQNGRVGRSWGQERGQCPHTQQKAAVVVQRQNALLCACLCVRLELWQPLLCQYHLSLVSRWSELRKVGVGWFPCKGPGKSWHWQPVQWGCPMAVGLPYGAGAATGGQGVRVAATSPWA